MANCNERGTLALRPDPERPGWGVPKSVGQASLPVDDARAFLLALPNIWLNSYIAENFPTGGKTKLRTSSRGGSLADSGNSIRTNETW